MGLLSIPVWAAESGIQVKVLTDAGERKEIQFYSGYHALVLGCDRYQSGWPQLKDRVKDAGQIVHTLKNAGWSVDFIENPNGRTLRHEIQKLVYNQGKERDKGILIFFSGHGYTLTEADGTGLGYMVPVDAPDPGVDPIGFAEKAVSMRDMETAARQMQARHVLMIFDAPLAGDVFLMEPAKPPEQINAEMTAPVRQFILAGIKVSLTSGPNLNKLFLQGVFDGLADQNQDGHVTGSELGFYFSNKLAKTEQEKDLFYGRINNPKLNQGDFVFAGPGTVPQKIVDKGATAKKQDGPIFKKSMTNSLGMAFNYIPPGTFKMGSPDSEPGRDADEARHAVTLTRGFYLQTTEVTQKQWKTVMGSNPSTYVQCGDDCPVETVSWNNVQVFIRRLNQLDGHGRYRLPTEAEWEYASRAGTDGATYSGPMPILGQRNAPSLDPIAWYGGNSCVDYPGGRDCSRWKQKQYACKSCGPHGVGLKKPNNWGLHDMLGNVYEWCQDYYGAYPKMAVTNPTGPKNGTRRVARGGAWDYHAKTCRAANRNHFSPQFRSSYLGFRLVMSPVR